MMPSNLLAAGKRWAVHAVLALAFLTLIVLAWFSYRSIDRELTDAALSRRAAIAYLAAATLSEKFDRLVDVGVSLATRVRFRELVEAGRWAEASTILSGVPADFLFIDRIILIDLRGTLMADVPEAPGMRGQNFAYRDWYQAVIPNGQSYVSQVYRRAAPPRMNVFVAAVPIKSGKGEMLGILVVQVRSDTFFEWTKGVKVGAGGLVYVVDRRGILAYHPMFPPQGDLVDYSGLPVVQRVLQGNKGVEIAFNPSDSGERVVAFEPIAKHGWGVVLEQPVATVFAARDQQLERVLIAFGVILIFMVCTAYLVSGIVIQHRQVAESLLLNIELEQRMEERSQAETALRESNALLDAMFELAPDAILLVNADGRIARANGVAVRMFGYGSGEIAGKPVDDLIPRRYRENHVRHRLGYAVQPRPRAMGSGMELHAVHNDGGEFPVDVTLGPLRTDGSLTVICIVRDITERRRAEDAIQLLNAELERRVSERTAQLEVANKGLEAFSYSVSHDLRGPLRSMDGFSLALLEDYGGKLGDEGKDFLQRIRAASQRMGHLIDDLLGLSQVTRAELNLTQVDLSALAREIAASFRSEPPGRNVQWQIEDGLTILADQALMRIAMQNLLDNAWKFTGKTPQATIRVGLQERDGKQVVFVADNGVGFDMAYADRLFGAFQRLHHAGDFPGTGIGLATAQRVIQRHHGSIWAEAREGQGATFFFTMGDTVHDSRRQDDTAGRG